MAEGEVVGFLGPNGAGKTTTLRMLTTLLTPTAGTATVAGYDVVREAEQVRRSIGYVSQSGSTGSVTRAGDEVIDHGMLYGHDRRRRPRRAARSCSTSSTSTGCGTASRKAMSGGQRRRLDIAMGLIHEPTLVFLDEPTTGLDPQARANLWNHIADLRDRRGATVFLTTHYLDEADALSDRIVVIDHGKIVAADTPDNLKAAVAGDLVDLEVAERRHVATAAEKLAALVADGRRRRGRRPPRPRAASSGPASRPRACCATSTTPASPSPRSRSAAPRSTTSSSPHRPLAARRLTRHRPRKEP